MQEIEGVEITKLSVFEDKRGWLTEYHRSDETEYQPEMGYISFTKENEVRGPHEHTEQSDCFVFTGPGDFDLYVWDNRTNAKTYKNKRVIRVGESNKVKIIIPPGVVHGYKAVTKGGAYILNIPNKLYKGRNKKEEVDEIRHEENPQSEFKIE